MRGRLGFRIKYVYKTQSVKRIFPLKEGAAGHFNPKNSRADHSAATGKKSGGWGTPAGVRRIPIYQWPVANISSRCLWI